jgi:hypothetical protein
MIITDALDIDEAEDMMKNAADQAVAIENKIRIELLSAIEVDREEQRCGKKSGHQIVRRSVGCDTDTYLSVAEREVE